MKINSTTKRLLKQIDKIKEDCEFDANLSFLSKKYGVARVTMKSFLIAHGIYKEKWDENM